MPTLLDAPGSAAAPTDPGTRALLPLGARIVKVVVGALAIVAVSIPLPWIAVLIANDRPPRRAEEPRRYENAPRHTALFPRAERPALEVGLSATAQPRAAHVVDDGSR